MEKRKKRLLDKMDKPANRNAMLLTFAQWLDRGSMLLRRLGGSRPSLRSVLAAILRRTENAPQVVDVGAYHGEFARAVIRVRRDAKIHCFEPIPSARAILEDRLRSYTNIKIYSSGIGDSDSAETLNVNEFGAASSMLHVTPLCIENYPVVSTTTSAQSVQMRRLDSVFPTGAFDLLKLDVQGYEREVINGAQELLGRTSWIITEVSFAPLYDKGVLVDEVCELLRRAGFQLETAFGWSNGQQGYPLQADFLFSRQAAR